MSMWKRTFAALLSMASIGFLWRFRLECGVQLWTAVTGSLCLAGMAMALALVQVDGGKRSRRAAGILSLAAGAAAAAGIYATPLGSTSAVADPPAVLLELILDGSEESRRLAGEAMRLKGALGERLVVVVYRSGEFLRPGLAEFDPPLPVPAAVVDYLPVGRGRDLFRVIEGGRGRDRLSPAHTPGPAGGEGFSGWTFRNSHPGRTTRLDYFALQLQAEPFPGTTFPRADSLLASGAIQIGPGETTGISCRDLIPPGRAPRGAVLLAFARERIEFAARIDKIVERHESRKDR